MCRLIELRVILAQATLIAPPSGYNTRVTVWNESER